MAKVKVLNISSNDLLGSRFNGHDLQNELLKHGVFSKLGVFWNHQSKEDFVFNVFPGKFFRLISEIARGIEVVTGRQATFQIWTEKIVKNKNFVNSDVVHLQIVHDHFLNLRAISNVTKSKPTIWTWHDLWPVTGHCIQPMDCDRWEQGCGSCPDLLRPLPVFIDRTRDELSRKLKFVNNLDVDIHVTTAWMHQQVKRFNFGKNVRIHEIPFGVDSKKFRPRNTNDLRKNLGITGQPFIVLARSTTDPIKGYLPLLKALDSIALDKEILLISVGEQNLASLHTQKLKVIELPWVNSSDTLSQLYSIAHIFAMPSLGESFGMMALESMACGTPVLAVKGTATAELVGDTGFLVDPKKRVKGIESAIRQAIENVSSTSTRGNEAQARAEQKFSFDLYVARMANLYNELAAR